MFSLCSRLKAVKSVLKRVNVEVLVASIIRFSKLKLD